MPPPAVNWFNSKLGYALPDGAAQGRHELRKDIYRLHLTGTTVIGASPISTVRPLDPQTVPKIRWVMP